jgi:CheY-like chemotaxis protein
MAISGEVSKFAGIALYSSYVDWRIRGVLMRESPLILTVEDEPRISRYLRSSLQMAGYDVLVAPDGVKALELVQENRPDLVLLDLGLPHMGGFEVLEHIRTRHRR